MLVKDVMSKKPKWVSPDTSIEQIAQHMEKSDFGFVPIGEDDKLIGTITDRDITLRAVAKGKDPKKALAREIMTKKVLFCYDDDDLGKAAKSMERSGVLRLIVLNHDKRMTGILSLGDIAAKGKNEALCGEVLQHIVQKRKAA